MSSFASMPTSSPNSKSASKAALRFRLRKFRRRPKPGKKSRRPKNVVVVLKSRETKPAKLKAETEAIAGRVLIAHNAAEIVRKEAAAPLAPKRAKSLAGPKNPPSPRNPNNGLGKFAEGSSGRAATGLDV